MKHLGDITKIKGCNAPVVDCVIGGSPCQDLSVAGKRAGLAGERSGLYMEQIRIIKEMRHKDEQRGRTGESIRPRYMVWENVPGAFSSNQGKDFAAVLEEAIKVAEPKAPDVPVPEKGWPTSGCIMGDTWSVAWRVLDAQFWGVPQRRRRIALVADFGGQSAPEILFVRKSVSGDIDESEQARKATAVDAENRTGTDDRDGIPYTLKIRSGCEGGGKGALIQTDMSATLSTLNDQYLFQPAMTILDDQGGSQISVRYDGKCPTLIAETHGNLPCLLSIENYPADSRVNIDDSGKVQTILNTTNRHAVVYGISPYHSNCMLSDNPHSGYYEADTARTLDALNCGYPGCNQGGMAVVEPVTYQKVTDPLMANSHPGSYTGQDAFSYMLVAGPVAHGVDCRNATEYEEQTGALQSSACHNMNSTNVVRVRYIVRRLTPLECERLQGYPDGWTDIGEWVDSKGKKHKEADSPRYKALGNSIAIPPWKWVLKRLCACYERDATMASLFDGIGGFPYIWEQLNGKGSCLWASEIEEFPMAVTKLRFGGDTHENHVI